MEIIRVKQIESTDIENLAPGSFFRTKASEKNLYIYFNTVNGESKIKQINKNMNKDYDGEYVSNKYQVIPIDILSITYSDAF